VTALDPLTIPRRVPGCRLRLKPGGRGYLIRFAQGFALEGLSSAIWRRLDGQANLLEVMAEVSLASGVAYAEVAQLTLACVELLASKGFVELVAPSEVWPGARARLATGLWSQLLPLSSESTRLASLEPEQRPRVVERFVQICWEMAANFDSVYASEETYWRFLAEGPAQALRLHLRHELELLAWTFRAERNQITMLFRGSTYTGDVDTRL
jgi:hypothetical protein